MMPVQQSIENARPVTAPIITATFLPSQEWFGSFELIIQLSNYLLLQDF